MKNLERKITMEDLDTVLNLDEIETILHELKMKSVFTVDGRFIIEGKIKMLYNEIICKDGRNFTVLDLVLAIIPYLKINEEDIMENDVVEYILHILCKDIFADLGALISNAIPMEYSSLYSTLFEGMDIPEESKDRMISILLSLYNTGDNSLSFTEYNTKHWDLLRFLDCLTIPAI